eukprot:360189-Chlamydomonas_euryale.AAC.1
MKRSHMGGLMLLTSTCCCGPLSHPTQKHAPHLNDRGVPHDRRKAANERALLRAAAHHVQDVNHLGEQLRRRLCAVALVTAAAAILRSGAGGRGRRGGALTVAALPHCRRVNLYERQRPIARPLAVDAERVARMKVRHHRGARAAAVRRRHDRVSYRAVHPRYGERLGRRCPRGCNRACARRCRCA